MPTGSQLTRVRGGQGAIEAWRRRTLADPIALAAEDHSLVDEADKLAGQAVPDDYLEYETLAAVAPGNPEVDAAGRTPLPLPKRLARRSQRDWPGHPPTYADAMRTRLAVANATRRVHVDMADLQLSTGLHRVYIPLENVDERALRMAGFTPAIVAIPEDGQVSPVTWRRATDNAHLHRHAGGWYLHVDKFPEVRRAMTRAWKGESNENVWQAALAGIEHAKKEGGEGWEYYKAGKRAGDPTFGEMLAASGAYRQKAAAQGPPASLAGLPQRLQAKVVKGKPMEPGRGVLGYSPSALRSLYPSDQAVGLSPAEYVKLGIPDAPNRPLAESLWHGMPGQTTDMDTAMLARLVYYNRKRQKEMPTIFRLGADAAAALAGKPDARASLLQKTDAGLETIMEQRRKMRMMSNLIWATSPLAGAAAGGVVGGGLGLMGVGLGALSGRRIRDKKRKVYLSAGIGAGVGAVAMPALLLLAKHLADKKIDTRIAANIGKYTTI